MPPTHTPEPDVTPAGEHKIHRVTITVLLVLMLVQGIYLAVEQNFTALFPVALIILTMFSPILFRKKLQIELPAEFHLIAVLFTFSALYLGEVQSFYERFWWWDVVLHTTAGFLSGIVGFLLIYILNESKRVEIHLTAGFIAFFAFVFAVMMGTMWEIFEFSMDQIFSMNMQKPMLGDPSGLTDTMWDIIVNATGALLISLMGWRYLKLGDSFFVKKWIRTFIEKNPSWFLR